MKEMHRIIKFSKLESSTFEKGFCERPTEFSFLGVMLTLLIDFQQI